MTLHANCDGTRRRLLKGATAGALLSLLPGALWPLSAEARPDPEFNQPLPPGIVEKGSGVYDFRVHRLASPDGQRHYRITVAIPKKAPPEAGYTPVYLLDGNAALAALDEQHLKAMDGAIPPVLIALGYDTDQRFDVVARQWDYTPKRPEQAPIINDRDPERRGGGADDFITLLNDTLMAEAERNLPINTAERALWGHSFGGLFVLHALFTRPALFDHWYAASPSLSWNGYQVVAEAGQFQWPTDHPGSALLMRGDAELKRHGPYSNGGSDKEINDQMRNLAQQMDRLPGFEARFEVLEGMGHGAALARSLKLTLSDISGAALT
ncbi:alpha/beta hydrolase [Kushneria phyllosphaerae]|uniref:Acyl-CoA:diacylglycerol acyltransferase n=1 Tax=Kushneria phyllosphaerae TaxID=2100822 RepID=A0A2R8CLV3_9GAMM|nr:alpha/beta hydrolase-fold protein [Kushneria phyllosphaerae]SPJ33880.1 Ferri-bacillibactin esterase BesA [Kushneria phyllosphaerae]